MKVIVLALPKTGTHSLKAAYKMLGQRVFHMDDLPDHLQPNICRFTCDPPWFDDLDNLDVFFTQAKIDLWPLLKRFPDAVLVNCPRDVDTWISSCIAHVWENRTGKRQGIWTTDVSTWKLREQYEAHAQQIAVTRGSRQIIDIPICEAEWDWDRIAATVGKSTEDWSEKRLSVVPLVNIAQSTPHDEAPE